MTDRKQDIAIISELLDTLESSRYAHGEDWHDVVKAREALARLATIDAALGESKPSGEAISLLREIEAQWVYSGFGFNDDIRSRVQAFLASYPAESKPKVPMAMLDELTRLYFTKGISEKSVREIAARYGFEVDDSEGKV